MPVYLSIAAIAGAIICPIVGLCAWYIGAAAGVVIFLALQALLNLQSWFAWFVALVAAFIVGVLIFGVVDAMV